MTPTMGITMEPPSVSVPLGDDHSDEDAICELPQASALIRRLGLVGSAQPTLNRRGSPWVGNDPKSPKIRRVNSSPWVGNRPQTGTRNSSPWAGNDPKFRHEKFVALGLTLNNFFSAFELLCFHAHGEKGPICAPQRHQSGPKDLQRPWFGHQRLKGVPGTSVVAPGAIAL